MIFRIAGLFIFGSGFFLQTWCAFHTTKKQSAEMEISAIESAISFDRHRSIYSSGLSVAKLSNEDWAISNPTDKTAHTIVCTSDYRKAYIHASEDSVHSSKEIADLDLLRIPIECRFIHESIVSLHAACVEDGSCAVCFTGDSGVGKSTRAKVWVEALGAEFISGDRPAIRLETHGCTACGVPWDGKEQIFRNVERPLHAILEVRRAPFTRLRRLTQEQAYRALIRQCFIPMWDPDTAALAMVNVKRLCRITPVYRLFCGPDAEAARETRRILFDCPEEIQEELPDMKIREGFVLRNVADEHMVMPTGENVGKFGGAVVLSDVAAFVFEQLKRPVSREDLLSLILAEYDVDAETATADLDALLAQFREMNLLED